ncbi:MAG: hypothetical protein HGA33_05135 [Candidatus Moranbacteria bacterium]|nr:hypothetical protein [Candidatus Moranbacteria bacterium]
MSMTKAAAQLKNPKKRVAKATKSVPKKRRKKACPSDKVKAAAADTKEIVNGTTGEVVVNDLAPLMEAVGGDEELALFFLAWLKHDHVAWKAYKEIRPNVTDQSARVMGSQFLARINKRAIVESYDGLGLGEYLRQLKEGLLATKVSYERVKNAAGDEEIEIMEAPDHKTRRAYHRALGEILEMENVPTISISQNNLQQNNVASLTDDQLDGYLNR